MGFPVTSASTVRLPWRRLLVGYQQPDDRRSVLEIVATAVPLLLLWAGAWWAAVTGLWWAAVLLSVPAAAFVVRLFMIQNDCGHQSFFSSAALNNWVGRVIGVITLTPYDCWRRDHAIHHATSGDLDRRGAGSLVTLTVDEYRARTPLGRLAYRTYRNPFILFVVGPVWVFFVQQRLPLQTMREGWRQLASALATNMVLALFVAAAIWLGAWPGLVLVHVTTLALAAAGGVWLFFVQHQFEQTHWARGEAWDPVDAALKGSSHYVLPPVLRWLTANIGVHHVHHVASRIPFYRLPNVLKDHPELSQMSRVTLVDSIRCVGLALWDEKRMKLVSFADAR
jgi:omega-6 fatty acid desaturase (delta-12 desaturase)